MAYKSREEEERAEVEIWSQLDVDGRLLGMILARLPVPKLLQFRTVCKDWKCLIDSSYFSEIRLQVPSCVKINFLVLELRYPHGYFNQFDRLPLCPQYCAVNINCTNLRMYDPVLDTWYRGPSSFLTSTGHKLYLQSHHKDYQLLYVVLENGREGSGLLVCRPTSGSISERSLNSDRLIAMPRLSGLLSLVVDEQTSSFRLISVALHCSEIACPCKETLYFHTEILDSESNEWKAGPFINTNLKVIPAEQLIAIPTVIGHCVYYFLGCRRLEERIYSPDSPAEIEHFECSAVWNEFHFSFDWKRSSWTKVAGNLPHGLSTYLSVNTFERNGSIVLADLTRTDDSVWKTSLRLKLRLNSWNPSVNPDSITWTEIPVSVLPKDEDFQELFSDQRGISYVGFWRGHEDHLIFFSGFLWSHRALVYNMTSKDWTLSEFGPKTSTSLERFLPLPVEMR
ncbi:hypothetical protein MPTK1_4g23170 [Marchantia polymorpha subsp. ruderalis]|uniref:F-box domain-containing protein n=2 Tax=Marchantia polymorpha TaxID=3197 RepID=A0AAF6BCW2_MARPO|nr:hypothetical protein MARPO_0020s0080 [Marchantia polymorpha]BBN09846.1 hypothetical protein Mp_4g23170 [Marchantia polymorpha subsp. ruderalis]|eukprot:PTQ44423.1 hypothetical protein MARPO_0020s0080 [Marchantia polymorpha]